MNFINKLSIVLVSVSILYFSTCQVASAQQAVAPLTIDHLRKLYSKPINQWPKPQLREGVEHHPLGRVPMPTFPTSNPFSVAKMRLGEKLFHDPKLSRSGQIACASCHDRDLGWGDGREKSFGHDRQTGGRNSPGIENAAFRQKLFWDGRAATLEEQALMPIVDKVEMNFTLPELEQRLNANDDYKQQFKAVFGQEQITAKLIGQAIATYERTLLSRTSNFDRFLMAIEEKPGRRRDALLASLNDSALNGLHLFRTKAGCLNCHNGPTFSDEQFHSIGLTYYKRKFEDLGRYNVTKKPEDVGKFKTPSLRGVMNNKPWMHNGFFATMDGIMNIYNAGGIPQRGDKDDPLSPKTSHLLKPLNLNQQELKDLEEFMHAITAHPARGPHYKFRD
ncbi:MAG: cytochrome-c peroxidase [Psychrobium sp.]